MTDIRPDGHQTPHWFTQDRLHAGTLAAATAAGLALCYLLAAPFVPALTWALALAIVGRPAHRALEARLGHPNLSATISVLGLACLVLVPATFVAERLVAEVGAGAAVITSAMETGAWRALLGERPALMPMVVWAERQVDVARTVEVLVTGLTNGAATFVRGSVTQFFSVLLTFYFLFYMLRDRRSVIALLRDLSPLSSAEMNHLFDRVVDTVYATIYGTVAVAVVQGVLGGLMFWWLDLPGALVWGAVMALLAVVPVLGAFIVWIPAACFLVLSGRWGDALLLCLWGLVVVGGIDNLLYPVLVGNRLKLHTVPALIAVIGGVVVFGASGVILGPIVVAVTASLLEIWRVRANAWRADQPPSTPLGPTSASVEGR